MTTTHPFASDSGLNLDHLEALARAATPGPWSWWTSNSTLRLTGADGRDGGVLYGYARQGDGDVNCAPNDQAFIAAANPAALLALIALARRAQPEGKAPQDVTCARCDGVGAVSSGARTVLCDACNGSGELHPAATLSPLCGAQHAESGREDDYVPAEALKHFSEKWLRADPLAQSALASIIENQSIAAQQAAAPGAQLVIGVAAPQGATISIMQPHADGTTTVIYGGTHPVGDSMGRAVFAAAPSAPGTPEAPKKPAHGHRDDYYLLANGRRLGLEPISRVRNMPNWVLAMELFATGSTSAHQLCRDAGVDPDSTTTQRAAQLDGGQEGSGP